MSWLLSMPLHRRLPLLILLGLCWLSSASARQNEATTLAMSPAWLQLLHYEKTLLTDSGWRSAIHDTDFFLTPEGNTRPADELQAMLAQLQTPATDPEQSVLCRFPARALWLQKRLGLQLPHPFEHCPSLRQWSRNNAIESVSLVFATGYLGNPASYYGHTLLKLNFSKQAIRSRLRDISINYGAIDAQQDDPVSYIFKGVFGGYDGGFSESEYFMLENNYAENEFRDIWEYQLALTPAERTLITAHVREVLGRRYTYYFFRKNCAYRIAELLEISDPLQFIPAYRPWTIPQSVLGQLEQQRPDGSPLLQATHYWPSRQARFYRRLDALDASERALFSALAREELTFASSDFQQQPLESRQRILDAALDYSQYVRDPETEKDAQSPLYRSALQQRYLMPQGTPAAIRHSEPVSPHRGRKASWLQAGLINRDGHSALGLRLRPAYYDWLDVDADHATHAALSMADLSLAVSDDEVRLRHFNIIAIESANPGRSGLPGDRGIAWNLKASVEPVNLECDSCLVPRLASDVGLGRQFTPSLYAAAYVGGALQNDRADAGYAYGKTSLRMLYQLGRNTGVLADYGRQFAFGGETRDTFQLEARQALGQDLDLRLRYEHDEAREISVGLGYYW